MSSIAQKLCDEICEESPLKHSKHSTRESCKKLNQAQASNSRYDGRPTRSIVVEKKRVVNKVVPSSSCSKSKIVINKFKSKETLLKKTFVDSAQNTIITGPLRCDNDCVTMVRKRDNKGNCKCGNKRINCRVSAKEIQTFDTKNYCQLDKACAQCVETVNCGTQFLERLSSRKPLPLNMRSQAKLCNEIDTQTNEGSKENEKSRNDIICSKSKINYNFMGARRWALSQFPARGPDF
ncbi:uncharacterized protein LOC114352796 [Ostrinia furnacalis]|uniref:uncharacterized protein LOC114352796 n=1 Tax=Ostrinia furnacalis TaxID=93504 RepID=UPI001039D355|nr:uncharacterized protein LOC114352796 [Ostrinia furnacalis]